MLLSVGGSWELVANLTRQTMFDAVVCLDTRLDIVYTYDDALVLPGVYCWGFGNSPDSHVL